MIDDPRPPDSAAQEGGVRVPDSLPVLPLSDSVVFPFMMVPLILSDERLIRMADEALAADKTIALFTQKEAHEANAAQNVLRPLSIAGEELDRQEVEKASEEAAGTIFRSAEWPRRLKERTPTANGSS